MGDFTKRINTSQQTLINKLMYFATAQRLLEEIVYKFLPVLCTKISFFCHHVIKKL